MLIGSILKQIADPGKDCKFIYEHMLKSMRLLTSLLVTSLNYCNDSKSGTCQNLLYICNVKLSFTHLVTDTIQIHKEQLLMTFIRMFPTSCPLVVQVAHSNQTKSNVYVMLWHTCKWTWVVVLEWGKGLSIPTRLLDLLEETKQ